MAVALGCSTSYVLAQLDLSWSAHSQCFDLLAQKAKPFQNLRMVPRRRFALSLTSL